MEIVLTCSECSYQGNGSSKRGMMNKIIMWNHVKRAHPSVAERIMRMHTSVPNDIYGVASTGTSHSTLA